jgi:hypothetical protein
MKKIEVQILLHIDKKIQRYMLNSFGIILFYKVVGWFDVLDIGVKTRRPRFNPLYQHTFYAICIIVYIYLIHVCKCIIHRWVMDR